MAEPQRWEYRVASAGTFWTGATDESIEATLNEWGAEGWEVVAVTKIEGSNKIRVVAKRPASGSVRRERHWPT